MFLPGANMLALHALNLDGIAGVSAGISQDCVLLHAGITNLQDAEVTLEFWTPVLEAATTLVESNSAYRQQACMHPWVNQHLQHNRTRRDMSLQMLLQACQG